MPCYNTGQKTTKGISLSIPYSGLTDAPSYRIMSLGKTNVAILLVVLMSAIQLSYQQYPLMSTLVRRNVPPGATIHLFMETCEACGEMFGSSVTYKCLTDRKSFYTYFNCRKAIS
uniref:Uncharacterized protein n=2 Tax=Magallana gigas TaxID=29159 RepID=A0A8W8N405_MAGGI